MYPFLWPKPLEERLITVDALRGNSSGRRTIIRNDITSGSIHAIHGGPAVVRPQGVPAQPAQPIRRPYSSKNKSRIKSSTVAIYASVFTLLVSIIAVGYRTPEQVPVGGVASVVVADAGANQPAVNEVLATNIAASVAQTAELAVAPNVTELAISTRVKSEFQNASTDDSTISKPAIVQLSTASRNISSYAVEAGDTVQTVAAKYGLSVETIKWANNLTSDSIAAGSTIDILPRNGIAYVVRDGDTVEKIAAKYKANVSLVTTYNDLEINGLTTGLKIIIPDGILPNEERPGYVAPVATSYYSSGFVVGVGAWSGSVMNMYSFRGVDANSGGYALGNCTAYAYYRRAQIGRPVPSQLGNAYTWATQARAFNYVVNKTPAAGAVIQSGNHVGVVEEVLPNGDLRITDMNYGYRLYNLAERIIPASTVHNYMFIH